MKKLIMVTSLFVLSGCSGAVDSVSDQMPAGELEVKKEVMDEQVHIYSLTQNAEGYVFKWDERTKYAIVPASVVVEHPKVLVKTSTDQILEGTVTYINTDLNEAIIKFRNSATLASKEVDRARLLEKYTTYTADGERRAITNDELDALIELEAREEVPFEARQVARESLAHYKKQMILTENIIETYEKDTFKFDRDALQQALQLFVSDYNQFVTGENQALVEMIQNDDLLKVFNEWEDFSETYKLLDVDVTSLQYTGYIYRGVFEATMGVTDPKNVVVSVSFVKTNQMFKVITFTIET